MLDFWILRQGEKYSVEYCWRKGQMFGFTHILGFCTAEAARDWIAIRKGFEETEPHVETKSD